MRVPHAPVCSADPENNRFQPVPKYVFTAYMVLPDLYGSRDGWSIYLVITGRNGFQSALVVLPTAKLVPRFDQDHFANNFVLSKGTLSLMIKNAALASL